MLIWFSQLYDQPTRLSCRTVVKIKCRKCCRNWRPPPPPPPQVNASSLINTSLSPKYYEKSNRSKIILFCQFLSLINKGFRIASCSVVKERIGKRLQHNDPEWGFWHRRWDLKERDGSLGGLKVSVDGLNVLLRLLKKRLLSIKRPLLAS